MHIKKYIERYKFKCPRNISTGLKDPSKSIIIIYIKNDNDYQECFINKINDYHKKMNSHLHLKFDIKEI